MDLFMPLWRLRRWLLPSGRRFLAALRVVDDYAYSVVRRRRKQLATAGGETEKRAYADLLTLYLTHPETKSSNLSDHFLRNLIMNILIAGRDTTAQALSWTFFLLATHKDIQDNAAAEAHAIIGASGVKRHVSYEEVAKMKYILAVFNEALRLFPSVPKEGRICNEADTWPDGTRIKPGEWANFTPYSMGRSEELWGEDCLEFRPERFLADTKPSPFIFTAFLAGPRMCLGQNLAYLEARTVIARILASYTVSLPEAAPPVEYDNSITLPMKHGLWLRFERRVSSAFAI
eukprot:scaffold7650_cov439-Pinguiococcus_pyrenoidosus.AAC.1